MMRRARKAIAALAAASLVLGPMPVLAQDSGALAYQPQTSDERGLWLEMDEAERTLKTSRFVVRDPELNAYVRGVLCREVGEERCRGVRIYIVRTPGFNASMAPNGMMQVWTGLLLRMRNEAQLAAVLGHEFGHFEHRHSLQNFRSIRGKTDAMAWLSFLGTVGLVAQVGLLGSIFSFNRDMEREADVVSIGYMRGGGYSPGAAAAVWRQVIREGEATAIARKQKPRRHGRGFLDSHPAPEDRMTYLANLARDVPDVGGGGFLGAGEYRGAMAKWWAPLIDDQIKLNDFGGTEWLLEEMALGEGWTPELLYARGELYRARGKPEDFAAAAGFYREALAKGYALPELRRGLGLALLRTGATGEGRALLKEYVTMQPDAADRPMIAMLAGGE
ncbi:MAG TPA: M48 family metallopeptidase [Sphingomonas sp.]|nr:M48 family metallopeptidase [Sphingomonas sp.]